MFVLTGLSVKLAPILKVCIANVTVAVTEIASNSCDPCFKVHSYARSVRSPVLHGRWDPARNAVHRKDRPPVHAFQVSARLALPEACSPPEGPHLYHNTSEWIH